MEFILESFHAKRYTIAATIYLYHSDADMLMELYHICWVGDATVGHLGDMYKTILMDTDIYEGSEIGDVGDNAWQFHTLDKIVDGVYT